MKTKAKKRLFHVAFSKMNDVELSNTQKALLSDVHPKSEKGEIASYLMYRACEDIKTAREKTYRYSI